MIRGFLALLLIAGTAQAQLSVRQIGEISPLPPDGSVQFGDEPAAVTTPGFAQIRSVTQGERDLAESGGFRLWSDGVSFLGELETKAGTEVLVVTPSAWPAPVEMRWTEEYLVLQTDVQTQVVFLSGDPTPNLGGLSAGSGGPDAVSILGWRVGAVEVFANSFEGRGLEDWSAYEP